MSSQGEYYTVRQVGSKWVAVYDQEQHLDGQEFDTEAEAWAFVDADSTPQHSQADSEEQPTPRSEGELRKKLAKLAEEYELYTETNDPGLHFYTKDLLQLIAAEVAAARVDELKKALQFKPTMQGDIKQEWREYFQGLNERRIELQQPNQQEGAE